MDNKIFLGKYRISAAEIAAVGELTDSSLAYEGEEIETGKKVVVEVVPAAALKPAVRERLEAEAAAAQKLNHANIPALYDFGVEDDRLVYVTEDFEGTLAEEWVNAHGPMPVGPGLAHCGAGRERAGRSRGPPDLAPRHQSEQPGAGSRPDDRGRMAPDQSAAFRRRRPEVFRDRCFRGCFRQGLALREPGTNPARRGRFPVRDLFARLHDVVPFDGRAASDDAARADGRTTNANGTGSNGCGSG